MNGLIKCSHTECDNQATKQIVFYINHIGSERKTKMYPPIYACDECATEESATEIFSYNKGRQSAERAFNKVGVELPDWEKSKSAWVEKLKD